VATSLTGAGDVATSPAPSVVAPRRARRRRTAEWTDSLLAQARALVAHRELLLLVAQREVKVRYRQTALGVLWAVAQPLSLMLVLTVFCSYFLGIRTAEIPYPLFSYVGLLPWTFLTTTLSFATPSLINQSHIITKIYFPREIVPLATVVAALVDFASAGLVLLGLLAFYQVMPTWNVLWVIPIFLIQVTLATALALLLSGLAVVYRDVRFVVPLLLQIWMFATPILYPLTSVPESIRGAYLALNPMAVVVDGYRRAVVEGRSPELTFLTIAALSSLVLLWVAYRTFKRLEKVFADLV
jgi:lipopolysaccharide transport system permease protein